MMPDVCAIWRWLWKWNVEGWRVFERASAGRMGRGREDAEPSG